MANVDKEGGQAQGAGPQTKPGEGGEIVPRESQQVVRDPLNALMRDPFQFMREMMIDPFRMLSYPMVGRELTWTPSFEVRETDDAFVFKADTPGVDPKNVDITLDGNRLQISGRREHEEEHGEGRFHTYERSYGTFSRTFLLPDSADVDNIRSDLKDGVLTLVVPKRAGSAQRRRKIAIGSGGEKH